MQNSAPNLVKMSVERRRKRLRIPDVVIALLYHLRAVDKNSIIEKNNNFEDITIFHHSNVDRSPE